MSLLDEVADLDDLYTAWKHVKRNRRVTAGFDKISVDEFESNLPQNLASIKKDLLNRKYNFNKIVEKKIQKKDKKKFRKIAVYTVRDKIVLKRIQLLFEREHNPIFPETRNNISIGFIRRISKHEILGIKKAIDEIPKIVEAGNVVMTSADILNFFDKLDLKQLKKKIISRLHPDTSLDWLIEKILQPQLCKIDRVTEEVTDLPSTLAGVTQGSVLSPLLSNIYLAEFDGQLEKMKIRAFRYADDLVFFSKNVEEAQPKLLKVEKILKEKYKLSFHPHDSDKKPKHYRLDIRHGIYLGLKIERSPKGYWIVQPIQSKVDELKRKIIEKLSNEDLTFSERISSADVSIEGWNKTYKNIGCDVRTLKDIYSVIRKMYLFEVNKLLMSKGIISKHLNEEKLNFLGVLTDKYLFGVSQKKVR